jgi:transcriptional regulator with XRE-family HTH domain
MERVEFNRIKVVLVEKKITSKELGTHLGVGKSALSKWCNNHTQPTAPMFLRIAAFLDVDVRELIVPTKK